MWIECGFKDQWGKFPSECPNTHPVGYFIFFMVAGVCGLGALLTMTFGGDDILSALGGGQGAERQTTVGNSKFADPRHVQHFDILKRTKGS